MLRIASRTHGGPILRAAVFLVLALSLAGTLLGIVPVAAYYATAQYAYATFDYEVNGLVSGPEVTRLKALAPGGLASFLLVLPGSVEPGPVGAARPGPGPVAAAVLFADPGSDLAASWFTDATVTGRADVGADWVDLSATLAQRLGVEPGDPIRIPLTSGQVSGRVRRVLALGFRGGPVAVAPRSPLVDRLLPAQAGRSTLVTLRSSSGRAAVAGAASGPSKVAGEPAVEPVVQTRAEAAADAAAEGGVQGNGLRLFATLGVLLLVGLAVREGHAVVTRRADALAVAVAVGARRRAVLTALLTLEAAASAVVGVVVWWAVRSVGFGTMFPDAWPPRLDGVLALALAAALTSYLAAVLLVGVRSFSYERLLATVREGQAL